MTWRPLCSHDPVPATPSTFVATEATLSTVKGKAKALAEKVDDSENKEEKPKREERILYANEAFWRDITDWREREDCPLCPLLELLNEIWTCALG